MPKRSYNQHCALARALDVVGERWTLLLIRELLTGPRRYKELLSGLAGIGTNLLAARLRELAEAGVIERSGTLYELTERGRELEPAVLALARFGAPYLERRDPAALWKPEWNVVALKYVFQPEQAQGLKLVVEFEIDGVRTQARLDDGAIETTGEERWKPDLLVRTDGGTFLGLGSGEVDPQSAIESGALQVQGDVARLGDCLAAFASG